ncbi:hypothetical protein MRB53_038438 [Persea americana]|nr:hypothetical protein MRB53_038438 [Persea americana]
MLCEIEDAGLNKRNAGDAFIPSTVPAAPRMPFCCLVLHLPAIRWHREPIGPFGNQVGLHKQVTRHRICLFYIMICIEMSLLMQSAAICFADEYLSYPCGLIQALPHESLGIYNSCGAVDIAQSSMPFRGPACAAFSAISSPSRYRKA